MQLADAMLRAEAEIVPIDTQRMDPNWAEALYLSPALHTRLLSLTSGVSFQVVNATNGNGLEAWRLLAKKFNPTTPASCVALMTQIINFRITKSEDVLSAIVRWESLLTTLSRDHKEELSETMKIAFLLKAPPTALGDRLMELMDRLVTYKEVHDKIVNLVQSSSRYNYGDAMDVSGVDSTVPRDGGEEMGEEISLDALSRDTCARCGGFGHYAKDCATPQGKARPGKGSGKGNGKGADSAAGKVGQRLCYHCGKPGHTKANCWELNKGAGKGAGKRVNGLDDEETTEPANIGSLGLLEIGAVSLNVPSSTISLVRKANCCSPCQPSLGTEARRAADMVCAVDATRCSPCQPSLGTETAKVAGVTATQCSPCQPSLGTETAKVAGVKKTVCKLCPGGQRIPSLETESESVRTRMSSSSSGVLEDFYSVPRTTVTKSSKKSYGTKSLGGKMVPISFVNKTKFSPLESLPEVEEESCSESYTEVEEKSLVKPISKDVQKSKSKTKEINAVERQNKRYVSAGRGKVTIDSGAGESVCPVGWVPLEPIKSTDKVGVKYTAAGGQTLINQGEKQIKFKTGSQIASMNFQAINELSKPLASAAKIAAKDNTIVMRGPTKSSYIENDSTGVRIPIHIENGVYAMSVDLLVENTADQSEPFGRPA